MTVSELIEHLKTQPQQLSVAFQIYSSFQLLEAGDIEVKELDAARHDGWIDFSRPDRPTRPYLVFPGN